MSVRKLSLQMTTAILITDVCFLRLLVLRAFFLSPF